MCRVGGQLLCGGWAVAVWLVGSCCVVIGSYCVLGGSCCVVGRQLLCGGVSCCGGGGGAVAVWWVGSCCGGWAVAVVGGQLLWWEGSCCVVGGEGLLWGG